MTEQTKKKTRACRDTDYLFVSAYLRAKEPQLLSREKAERMLASSVQEAARILEGCGYADVLSVGLDRALNDRRTAVFDDLEAIAPKDGIVSLFRMRYDYHNAKTSVKAEAMDKDPSGLLLGGGRVDAQALKTAYETGEAGPAPQAVLEAMTAARDALSRSADPQLADLILDRAYFAEYHAAAAQDEFVQNSIFAPEPDAQDPGADTSARLYADAYSGSTQLSVSGKSPGSVTVTAIGVGGDYFLFHPLQLLSGGYVSDEDYMADRVVLDAQTAFNLFGSSDVAGMEVTINGKTFPIAGVVKSEDDFATAAALDAGAEASSDPTGVQSASKAMIYMSYAALNAMAELPIDCYEIVLPDPVSGFAKKLMTEKFPVGEGAIVQNTGRFSLSGLISVIGKFGKRVMTTNGVIYPYWENAARMAESYAALLLILGTLFGLMPAVCLTIVLVKLTVREIKRGYYKAAHAIEDRVEENKRKHYVSGGI